MYLGDSMFDAKWVGKVNGLGGAGRSIWTDLDQHRKCITFRFFATKSASTDQHPSKASLTSGDQKDIHRTRNNLVTWFAAGDFGQSKVSKLFVTPSPVSSPTPWLQLYIHMYPFSPLTSKKKKKIFNLPPKSSQKAFFKFLKFSSFLQTSKSCPPFA